MNQQPVSGIKDVLLQQRVLQGDQLFQAQLGVTAASIAVVPSNTAWRIRLLVLCNVSGGIEEVTLFHDKDGTTYTAATAILWGEDVDADTSQFLPCDIYMTNPSGHLAGKCLNANGVTVTAYGEEFIRT